MGLINSSPEDTGDYVGESALREYKVLISDTGHCGDGITHKFEPYETAKFARSRITEFK